MAQSLTLGATGVLALADGTVFEGVGVGATGQALGEVCFNTAMTGYQEILTDPSYMAQIVAFTFPHVGNVGVNLEDIEQFGAAPARPRAARSSATCRPRRPTGARRRRGGRLDAWLKRRGVVGLAGIDTRALTRAIREKGMPHGVIAHAPDGKFDLDALVEPGRAPGPAWSGLDLAKDATCLQPFVFEEGLWTWPEGYAEPAANRSTRWWSSTTA